MALHEAYPALSLVPPLLAIVLAIVTRRPILSLFIGIWSGGVIVTGGLGIGQTFDWLAESIADVFHAQILIFTLLLGSGVALIWRLGGAHAVRDYATERLGNQRSTGLTTWVLGLAMFFDDYANTAIVGSTMKDISDRMRISREKLSYIVDSTAAPVATLAISSWVAFQISMIIEGYEVVEDAHGAEAPDAFATFVQSIPYNAYAIFAIAMVGIVVYTRRDFGEMLDAEHRAWKTGKVNREGATPMQDVAADLGPPIEDRPMLRTFFAPVIALIVVTVFSGFWTGYDGQALLSPLLGLELATLFETLGAIAGDGDWAAALVWGSFVFVLTAIVIGLAYGLFGLDDSVETVLDGFGIMLTAVTILVLAWGISAVAGDIGTGEFVAGYAEGVVSPALLPIVVVLISAFVAFTMGSSWATMGIVTPIAILVAFELTGDFTLMPAIVGAVFSGAIFGDHTSPISDTTVLSSTFTGADLIDHVRTQLYYATTVLVVALLALAANGYLGVPPIVYLPLGIVLLVGLVYALSELDGRRKGLDPIASSLEGAPPPEADPIVGDAAGTGSTDGGTAIDQPSADGQTAETDGQTNATDEPTTAGEDHGAATDDTTDDTADESNRDHE